MFFNRKLINIERKINDINKFLIESNLNNISEILGSNKKIFFKNLLAGISRGIGITIGVTILTAIIIYMLQKIIILNIPIISEYISDIYDIIKSNSGK